MELLYNAMLKVKLLHLPDLTFFTPLTDVYHKSTFFQNFLHEYLHLLVWSSNFFNPFSYLLSIALFWSFFMNPNTFTYSSNDVNYSFFDLLFCSLHYLGLLQNLPFKKYFLVLIFQVAVLIRLSGDFRPPVPI